MTLVIMAAGMGSRFGGLKQIEPVGPNGEFIIDYSIYDALRCGFTKVVFIIKEENYDIFKETVGHRFEDKIQVEYVFQKNDNVPSGYDLENRVKPLGTAHAILCCKDVVKEPFVVINSDDFYGYDAYLQASKFMKELNDPKLYGMMGYKIGHTLTENGAVKRGYCNQENGYLVNLVESKVWKEDGKIKVEPLEGGETFYAVDDDLVSMNMFIFNNNIFDYLEEQFVDFFEENKDNLEICEYLIPAVVFNCIKNNDIKVKVVHTDAIWHGVTYKEDKEDVVNYIASEIKKGQYPEKI